MQKWGERNNKRNSEKMGNNIRIFTVADVENTTTYICMFLYVTWQYLVFKWGSVLDKVSKIFQTGHPTREQIDLYNIGFSGMIKRNVSCGARLRDNFEKSYDVKQNNNKNKF